MVRVLTIFLVAMLALTGLLVDTAVAQKIGVASVVKNDVSGSIGQRTRVYRVGTSVFQNEVVATGPESSAQLLFRDETALTIGANSRITLDRYVYDPNAKSGDIAITIGQGAFRFVTGSADPSSYKIQTRVATMGFRGTIVEGYQSPSGALVLVVVEGSIVVTLADGTQITVNEGESVTIDENGNLVAGPAPWPGPTLDLDLVFNLLFDDQGNLLTEGDDVLPDWREFNDAQESRGFELNFPPPPPPPPPQVDLEFN
jgi:hypothetical protein